jgi:hypothetical protein
MEGEKRKVRKKKSPYFELVRILMVIPYRILYHIITQIQQLLGVLNSNGVTLDVRVGLPIEHLFLRIST